MENSRWPPSYDQNELKMCFDTTNMIEPKIVNEWSVDGPLQYFGSFHGKRLYSFSHMILKNEHMR
jgi:hypothetical protein